MNMASKFRVCSGVRGGLSVDVGREGEAQVPPAPGMPEPQEMPLGREDNF